MNTKTRFWFSVVTLVLTMGLLPAAYAAETTSSIKGNVYDASGSPVSGAVVIVEDLRTSVTRQFTTNEAGAFLASRLPVGGPYKVVTAGADSAIVDSITLGEIYNLTIDIKAEPMMEEVVVTGEQVNMVVTAAGPAATFNTFQIQTAAALNRDIVEVYTLDPRLNLDNEDDGFEINCAGKNPRFNSVTLDGVSQNDRFGLNSNGYSTAMGMPFPFDGIRQVAVELAPFDVTYGGFSACNINAVTKTGTNEFTGNVYYEFTNQNLRGDSLTINNRVTNMPSPNYEETNYGFSIGGPVFKDRLFFFGAYEKSEKPRFLARGPAGSNIGEVRDWLPQADFDYVDQLARNLYNYDTGGAPTDGSQEVEKYMFRLDWNISENHNATLIYNYFDGFQDRDSDGDRNEYEYANHFYVKGAESETTTLILNSQWTDAFSTEIFASTNFMDDSQVTVGPKDMGDHQIGYGSNTIYLGADDSRQANKLRTDSDFYKFVGKWLAGNHVITAGFEREELEIFNIFVQHSRGGEWDYYDDSEGNPAHCADLDAQGRFEDPDCGMTGIDKFELGRPSQIYYGSGGGTNIATDAAANFTNNNNALYIQDELYFPAQDLSLVFGLRYEWFDTSDRPNFNPTFTEANGIRNDANIDGVDILQPRFGFTWGITDDFQLRGGFGLYSGGNPNVWISNSYSNDGLTNAQTRLRNYDGARSIFDGTIPLTGAPGASPPVELYDYVASVTPDDAGDSFLVIVDPNFKQPGDWKVALGFTWDMPGDIQMDVDWLHSRAVDSAMYVDLSQEIVGWTLLGDPVYDFTNGEENYMLTNSPYDADTDVFSILFSKYWDNGLDMSLGYAYTDAEDIMPMTASVANSNYTNLAVWDINAPLPGKTNFEVPHRFTLRASYGHNFFGDYETRISIFGYSKEGQPTTFIMRQNNFEGDGWYGRTPLYVPTGLSDPNVVFSSGFDTDAFFAWIDRQGFKPGTVKRNSSNAKWSTRFDMYFSQELPTFIGDTRAKFYVKVYNLGNLLNDEWGIVNDAPYYNPAAVGAEWIDEGPDYGKIKFNNFYGGSSNDVYESRSLWDVRLGLEFIF